MITNTFGATNMPDIGIPLPLRLAVIAGVICVIVIVVWVIGWIWGKISN